MAAESILTYKKLGFPKTSNSEKSYRTVIEYVGPLSTLAAAEPASNSAWGDYDGLVTSTELSPIDGTDKAELTVTTEYFYESGGSSGTAREVSYEIEWVMFQRSMLEHPVFRKGGSGAHALTDEDITDIEAWKNEPSAANRLAFKYTETSDDSLKYLSANATKFAEGYNLGLETYEDYAPVARKITTYTGGPPGSTSAGTKDTPASIPGLPSGYEWRKTADRSIRSGKQTRWERSEEWTGAIKVLTAKDQIYF